MRVEVTQVRHALECEEVLPFFQPLMELRTGRLAGFEILARWLHPTHGPILPEGFISKVEELGLAGSLLRQMLR